MTKTVSGLDGRPLKSGIMSTRGKRGVTSFDAIEIVLDGEEIARQVNEIDGMPLPEPFGYKVMGVLIHPPKQVGGVHLADESIERMTHGSIGMVVLKLGPQAYKGSQFKGDAAPWVKPFDYVMIPRYGGQQFPWLSGKTLVFINDDQIPGGMPARAPDETAADTGS